MTIRSATPADIPRMVEMGRENYEAVNADGAYDAESAGRFCRDVILPNGVCFLSEGGMIGGVLCPRWAAPSVIEAVELMWFAADGSGFRLLSAFCRWARMNNATPVITSARLIPPAVLARYGLRSSETILRGARYVH